MDKRPQTADEVLAFLKAGNERFAAGESVHPRADEARRLETGTGGQKPVATILGLSLIHI